MKAGLFHFMHKAQVHTVCLSAFQALIKMEVNHWCLLWQF